MPRSVSGALAALMLLLVLRPALADDSEVLNFQKMSVFFQSAQKAYLNAKATGKVDLGTTTSRGKLYAQQALWKLFESKAEVARAINAGETPWTAVSIDGSNGIDSAVALAKRQFPNTYANLDDAQALVEFRAELGNYARAAGDLRARFSDWGDAVSDWAVLSRAAAAAKTDPFELPASLQNEDPNSVRTYINKVDAVVEAVQKTVTFTIPPNRTLAVYNEMVNQAKKRFPAGKAIDSKDAKVKGTAADTLNPLEFVDNYRDVMPAEVVDPKQETGKSGKSTGGGEVK